jgi:hypothetical protein
VTEEIEYAHGRIGLLERIRPPCAKTLSVSDVPVSKSLKAGHPVAKRVVKEKDRDSNGRSQQQGDGVPPESESPTNGSPEELGDAGASE